MKYKFNKDYVKYGNLDDLEENIYFKKDNVLEVKQNKYCLAVYYNGRWIFDVDSVKGKECGELIDEEFHKEYNKLDSKYMKIEVWIENELDYDTVKNHWLCDFKTEDKDIDEKEFYIYISTLEDLFSIIAETGEDIQITMFCDEPIIKII
jgi:hypothetical protein